MKTNDRYHLCDVQAVYSGPEGRLWEMLMGQQIHVGGFNASMDLSEKAGIAAETTGVDFCCCNGAGVRFLIHFCGVRRMVGVDATPAVLEQARRLCAEEAMPEARASFVEADVADVPLEDERFDFVWGEDAWCYVENKRGMIAEAARVVKPGGVIAFTDWIEGETPMTEEEAGPMFDLMKFPSILDLREYPRLLEENGCEVLLAEDTGRFPDYIDLYLNMVGMQLTSDVMRILDYNVEAFEQLSRSMQHLFQLVHGKKLVQGRFVARKKG